MVREHGVHTITAQCLLGRGVSPENVQAFLAPSLSQLRPPLGLAGLAKALPRWVEAAQNNEKVGIFGDYDVDGVTSATLLAEAMESFGMRVVTQVASRNAGYGFHVQAAQYFIDQGCTLIVTADCGTSDLNAIACANQANLPVIIIDHHTVPSADTKHPAFALINPFCLHSSFPFQGMASVGLAFYVMGALRTALKKTGHFTHRPEPDVTQWLDLVALGTVADLVPLSEENRILTTEGLRHLNLRRRPGIAALLQMAKVGGAETINEHTIGWVLGPRLNAPGRLGDAQAALDVLRAPNVFEAQAKAGLVETINNERRKAQDSVFVQAMEQLTAHPPGDAPAIVLAGKGWAHGVVGIIASRIVDAYHRPVVVISISDNPAQPEARGSARSFGGVHLYKALHASQEALLRFGGHATAAGLSMMPEHIDNFRKAFITAVSAQNVEVCTPLLCDADLPFALLNEDLVKELERLAPFGKGNEEPLFLSRNLRVLNSKRVGDGSHLKMTLGDEKGTRHSCIAFGLGEQAPPEQACIDAVYAPKMTQWQGRTRLDLHVKRFWLCT